MYVKVKGLVIRENPSGEADKFLTVLTQEFGRISIYAGGTRSLKNKYIACAQILAFSEFTIHKTDRFTRMTEASLIESFYSVRLDYEKFLLAAYIAQTAYVISTESPDEDGLLTLVLNALFAIAYLEKPLWQIKAAYELRLMCVSGFCPSLGHCGLCGGEVSGEVLLDILGGSLVCRDCEDFSTEVPFLSAKIPADVLAALRFVAFATDEKWLSFRITDDAADTFANVCERYILAHTEQKFDTLSLLKEQNLFK